MRTTIDRDGRVVPVPAEVELVDRPDGMVAVAKSSLPPLTEAEVRSTLDRLRR